MKTILLAAALLASTAAQADYWKHVTQDIALYDDIACQHPDLQSDQHQSHHLVLTAPEGYGLPTRWEGCWYRIGGRFVIRIDSPWGDFGVYPVTAFERVHVDIMASELRKVIQRERRK